MDPLLGWLWLALLGFAGGALTTVAGLGGGLMMTLVLSALWDPKRALTVMALALLVGNFQRVMMFRSHIDRRLTLTIVAGAAPGALLGGLLTLELPDAALRGLLIGAAGLALLRELAGLLPRRGAARRDAWRPGTGSIVSVSALSGLLTATSGGGGLLLGPLLLAAGVRAERFVVTASLVAMSVHAARVVGYSSGGLVDAAVVADAAWMALAIVAGNLVGRRGRGLLSDAQGTALTYGVLLLCVGVSVLGF